MSNLNSGLRFTILLPTKVRLILEVVRYKVQKPNSYTIWYIICDSIFDKIVIRKYPQIYFQLHCIPDGQSHWKKANFPYIGSPLTFPIDVFLCGTICIKR